MDLFEKNPNPMWIYDSESLRFLEVNQAAIDMYGWSREEFLSMTILDIRPREEVGRVRARAKRGGTMSASGPWRHYHKDGTEHYVRIASYPVEHAGRPARVVTVNDISDLVCATEALTQSEEMFRGLCASSPAGVYKADMHGHVLYVNPVLANIWHMTEQEMLGHGWQKRVHPDDLEAVMQGWLKANAAAAPYEHVFRIVLPSGEVRWIHGRSTAVRGADGKPTASIGTTDDITDERRANDALRVSEAQLRALTDQLPVALLYVDAGGRCLRANRTFEKWFNIPREKIVALNFEYFVTRGDGSRQYEADVRRAWEMALRGTPVQFEKFILVNGRKRTIEATYTPDVDHDGQVLGFIVLLHDITERRALEDQFRHAQKMEAIGRLAGGIAHDFNNILSVMNGYARIIEHELNGDGRLGRMSAEIHRAGERAARLTQQLLAFSRKQVSQPRVVRIDDLLRDDETMLRRLVSDSIFLEMAPGAGNACIEIDPHRFSQVLLNLVVNARDAMEQGGTLTIKTAANHRDVSVSVRDSGCGMSPEVRERLFEPFFTTKDEGKGTGLGLATVYGIVREAGGSVSVESAEGAGSTFTLRLPIARKAQAPEPVPEKQIPSRGTETILLIEDDSNIRYLLAHTLESCGYRVVQAENGMEGLAIAKGMMPEIDAVVSDVIMPKMSGQDVIASLRRLRPDLKALLVSGHIDADPTGLAGDTQTSFLYKPVPPELLTAELRRLLDGSPAAV